MAATISSPYDVEVAANFNFDNNAIVSNLYADGRKIKAREFWLGGNTISIDNAILQMTTLNINTRQTITAPNTSVYVQNYNGKYYYSGNGNHYFGKIFKEGTFQGDLRSVNTGILQVNAGDIRFLDANKTDHFIINSSSHIMMNDSSTQLMVNKTFVYNRNDCDLAVNFTGSGGNNLVLGNAINGNGFVELNRMNISGINAAYINPVQGQSPSMRVIQLTAEITPGSISLPPMPKIFTGKEDRETGLISHIGPLIPQVRELPLPAVFRQAMTMYF